jgi:hypothetical protein
MRVSRPKFATTMPVMATAFRKENPPKISGPSRLEIIRMRARIDRELIKRAEKRYAAFLVNCI